MSIAVKLFIGKEERELNSLDINYERYISENGKPSSRTLGGIINLTFTSRGDEDLLLSWMFADRTSIETIEYSRSLYTLKNAEIVFYEGDFKGEVLFKFKLDDCTCIEFHETFSDTLGMETQISLSSAIQHYKGLPPYVKSWNESWKPPTEEVYTPLPVTEPEEKNSKIVDYYLTDLNGNRIEKAKVGDKVYLNIETKDLIGELLTISLNDKNADYKYKGEILPNDKISDYKINSDFEKIKLEVVPQQGN